MTTHTQQVERIDTQRERIAALAARAGVVEIRSAEDNERAAKMLQEVKARAKDLDTERRAMTRPLDEAKRRIMDLFRPVEQELAEVEQHLKGVMLEWHRQEERRLAAERAAAEEERKRLEADAYQAVTEGRVTDAIVAAEDSAAVAMPAKAVTTARGTSVTYRYRAEVEDLMALVLAVANGGAPLSLISANQSALNQLAMATKQEGVVIPGVRFVREAGMSSRAAGVR